ncbi:hypothetical protein CHS0354_012945 [Potamilus streckersoni]|uniref:Nucleoporin p54 n=1 Tax=Potamilus streckersoni TaxID=2493646 RepID=A0AAE0VHC0_9BIVA|nr:hypothetical protein CHS0354_012945 [Potamilus streckersoni]
MSGFSFGTPATQSSMFSSAASTPAFTGFGQPVTSTGFTGFGTSTSTAAPTTSAAFTGFGGFGTTTQASTGGFGGTGTGFAGFGTGGTSTGTGFTGFGSGGTSTGFGTGGTGTGFGTGLTGTGFGTGGTGTGFGTGNTGTGFGTGLTGTGFGTGGTSTGFGTGGTGTGFGTGITSTGFGTGLGSTSGFGTGGSTTGFGTSTLGFGTGGTTSAFGTGLGSTAFGTGGSQFGAFGTGTTGLLGTQQQQQQQQQPDALTIMAQAVSLPQIFGDERDVIIAKWNQLQALWGTGRGFFNQNQSVPFTPDNPFCKFKAVGYSCLPTAKNEEGFFCIIIKRDVETMKAHQTQAIDVLHKTFGSKPNYTVCVEAVNPCPDNKSELVVYVLDRPQSGPTKRVPATDIYDFLMNPANAMVKSQLLNQLDADKFYPKTSMSPEQLKQYLDTQPAGIDPLLWKQAIFDNPDAEQLIPVPMIGFKELHTRLKQQEQQTRLHQQRLDLIAEDLSDSQTKHSNMLAKLEDYKRKQLELGHRLLKVIVRQEFSRKMGFAIQAEEEQLRVKLETLQVELNHPTQFKGRLNELMSQIRMQNHLSATKPDVNYQMEPSLQLEIKQILKQQQEGLHHLIQIIKEDAQDINMIEQSLIDSRASVSKS